MPPASFANLRTSKIIFAGLNGSSTSLAGGSTGIGFGVVVWAVTTVGIRIG